MPKKRILIIVGVVVLMVAAFVWRFIFMKEVQRVLPPPVIVTGKPSFEEIEYTESLTGDILPVQQANIYSRVSGNLEKVYVDIGSLVKSGQALALIDTTIFSQNVKLARANYAQTEVNYTNNKLTHERNKALLEQKLIAKQDFDNSKALMDASLAQKDAAYANLVNAQTQMSYCKITAPFSGVITKRMYDPGAYITSSTATQNSSLFTLMDVSQLKSYINIPERLVPKLDKILDIRVKVDALPNTVFHAKLKKISESVDLSTRTMAVEVDIDNPGKELKPGMFSTITLVFEKKENTMTIPNNIVSNDDNGDYLFIVNPDSTVTKRYIKLGIKKDTKYEVLSGLEAGERMVFTGSNLVKDKMKVKIAR